MLPFLKKKPEVAAAAAPLLPAWHPNFRNLQRLPDTKVVRTAFFINGVAVFVAVVALLAFVYNEYQLRDLGRQIDDWQRQIDRDRPASNKAIAQYKAFQTEAARVGEIDAFIKSRPTVSELLLRIGEKLPANIALDGFELRDAILTLRGTVRGAPDQASGYASAYLQLLRTDPYFAARFDEVRWGAQGLTRSPQTGRLVFEIMLRLKSAPEKKKAMTTADLAALVRKNPVSFGSGLAAVLLGLATYFRSDELPIKTALLEEKSAEGARLANNVRYGAQLPEQLAALTAAGREIDTHLIRGSELANNLQYFYRLEAETGAKLIELRQNAAANTAAKAPKTAYAGVSFTVSLQGDYPVLIDLLRRLENGQHYCRVLSATVAPIGPDRATPLKLALGLELLGQP